MGDSCGGVMVVAEQYEGEVHPVTFELLGKGREVADALGRELSCALMGFGVRRLASELIYRGADRVFVVDHPSLRHFDPVRYKANLVRVIEVTRPDLVLFGATNVGRSLAPRVAAALGTGLTADCIDVLVDERGDVVQVRPAFTGNIIARIKTRTRPVMATVRYRVMRALERDPSRRGEVVEVEAVDIGDTGLRVLGKVRDKEVRVSDADVVVACGRGLRSPEDLRMIEELAELLGGVVGCSKPLVDEGWLSRDHQVGFSGNVVRPRLYIACGISGSPQHLAGMRYSEVVVAINSDPSAPIFRHADYGIIGDLYEVVPRLIDELRRRASLKRARAKGASQRCGRRVGRDGPSGHQQVPSGRDG